MSKVIPKRVTAQIEGDFVVFLIGMRINKLWKVHKCLPVFRAMPRMIRELEPSYCGRIFSIMASTITVRHALACTMLAFLACGEGPGGGRDTVPGEAAETPRGDELMSQAEQDRRIDYIEFLTTNIEETKRFYSEVFGWEFTDYGPDYTSFTDGRLFGGFSVVPEVPAGGPLIVLYSTNLEEIEARISESGGKIVREVFEFPGGRRFHFTDPSKNELAVWSDR